MREMNVVAKGASFSHKCRYHQSMVQLHEIIWGWSQSFRHTTAKHVFAQLDDEIDKRIKLLTMKANEVTRGSDTSNYRRIMGIHLLADTQETSLPRV